MNLQAAFYQQLDSARALTAEPADQKLYIDWQKELDLDDVKIRLARSIALSQGAAVCKLFTGHIGAGKTTELNRVRQILETGTAGRRLFVSFLQAQDWMDLQDASPADVIFHMVRQLIDDLDHVGCGFGFTSFQQFFPELKELFQREVELRSVKVPASLAEFGMVLKDVPVARATLRMLIQGRQPTIFQLINEVVLAQARACLRKRGYEDVLLIVDGLEKIPQKVINDRGLTNHENLFLDHQNVLRALNCHVLYTIPIALAYSRCRKQLEVTYGTEVYALPAIPVVHRDKAECPAGIDALGRIVEQRAAAAGGAFEDLFETREVLRCACRISGGHVRSLFMLLRSALERSDRLPIVPAVIEKTFRRQSADIRLGMKPEERDVVAKVHHTKQPADDNPEVWYGLLRDLYVFGYDYKGERWYDWNPLLDSSSGCQA